MCLSSGRISRRVDGDRRDNVQMMEVREGALKTVFRNSSLVFTSGKAELRGEIALEIGLNGSRTWPAAVNLCRDSFGK